MRKATKLVSAKVAGSEGKATGGALIDVAEHYYGIFHYGCLEGRGV